MDTLNDATFPNQQHLKFSLVDLLHLLARPYDDPPEQGGYHLPPEPGGRPYRTFCGT